MDERLKNEIRKTTAPLLTNKRKLKYLGRVYANSGTRKHASQRPGS